MALSPAASPLGSVPSPPASAMRSSPALPTNSAQFNFSCRCLNVQVDGRISLDTKAKLEAKRDADVCEAIQIWLGDGCEHAVHPAYVTYDVPESGAEDGPSTSTYSPDTKEDQYWRTCWVCNTRIYWAAVSAKDTEKPAAECWVVCELGAGVKELETALAAPRTPFGGLLLDLPSAASTFGRPPQAPIAPIYPSRNQPVPPSHSLIPDVYDPFFLPPPFIPNHPHLQALCQEAVAKLKARHTELENEVKQYIVLKARDMMQLEESVRSEVEYMWNKYAEGPGRIQARGRSASLSASSQPDLSLERTKSRERVTAFSPTRSGAKTDSSPSYNPIMMTASANPPFPAGTSLLSASISANYANTAMPPHVPDAVENTLEDIAQNFDKTDDQRAVAMSYVFSALDDRMANSARQSQGRKPSGSKREPLPEQAVTFTEEEDKDSWIQIEKKEAAKKAAGPDAAKDATPKPDPGPVSKGKEKHKVTFQEPARDSGTSAPTEPHADHDAIPSETNDEEVFDFEMEDGDRDRARKVQEAMAHDPSMAARASQLRRDLMESNIMKTFAANAPSHRHAWPELRRLNASGSSTRLRRSDDSADHSEAEDEDDEIYNNQPETNVSGLATSVPIFINMPVRPSSRQPRMTNDLPAMEHKTSLCDRGSVLVPSLFAAMRERGIQNNAATGNQPSVPRQVSGSVVQRRNSRSVSGSRDRERVRQFQADPGAVFEAMADDVADDDEDGEGEDSGEDAGTLRDSRTFVPPHVLARKESLNSKDVGWRSMVNE